MNKELEQAILEAFANELELPNTGLNLEQKLEAMTDLANALATVKAAN